MLIKYWSCRVERAAETGPDWMSINVCGETCPDLAALTEWASKKGLVVVSASLITVTVAR